MKNFIPISKPSITQLEIDYVTDAVSSTWVSSLGPYIDRFEADFAKFCGSKNAIAVSNGTVAIHLAVHALNLGVGDEVIMPNLSFIATANAVLLTGAKPIFADIDPFNLCIDPSKIEKLITSKTKAIMPVHLYGHPADMKAINAIAEKYNLLVIEDAAEAHGASIDGKRVGSWGKCATFSFYGNKNLTTGEGGMITTDDDDFAAKCRYLRDHAMSKEKRYWHTAMGFNYRMTNIQAALGCAQLDRIDELMEKREKVFKTYEKELAGTNNVKLNRTSDWAHNSYWLVCLELEGYTEDDRDDFMVKLKEKMVDSRPYFYPMSMMPYINENPDTPKSFEVYKKGINLPSYIALTEEEIKYICDTIKSIV
jgi:perosamine synthetase